MSDKKPRSLNSGISTDCVIFGFDFEKIQVLLIEREIDALDNQPIYALPGDLIYNDENLDEASERVLQDLTGLSNIFMEQLGAFGNINRLSKTADRKWLNTIRSHPEMRVITVAYYALVNINSFHPKPSHFARSVVWKPLKEISELAFDHLEILEAAKLSLKRNLELKPVGLNLLPEKFTLTQLQKLYESILGRQLDKRNFRRKILKLNLVEKLNIKQRGVSHKPSNYFCFNMETYNRLLTEGYNNMGF